MYANFLGIQATLGYWHEIKNRQLLADDVHIEDASVLCHRILA